MSKLGFTKPTLRRLIGTEMREGHTDRDAAPGAQKISISRPGDVWLLGKHRLLCGDATNPDHVALALGELRPQLMVTDQPYGVNYAPQWRAGRDGETAPLRHESIGYKTRGHNIR